ncbi:hypothetical protein, partial [Pseudomonas sp. MPR-R5A]|uniref:hypothetical protein n=1 Tax=Pseudomonas sp. MPR-R5A TaxID=2070626 RepID=UPI000CABA3B1
DFVEKYRYQKHVRSKTAIKVIEFYHEIHRKYNPMQPYLRDAITLLQNNSFKSVMEFAALDYLAFIDNFYAADEAGIHQADF